VIFTPCRLAGAFQIDPEPHVDNRGSFARIWCRDEFHAQGLDENLAQCSVSTNRRKGTLRGMHYQLPPNSEAKMVRCIRGRVFDVIVDLRPDSSTVLQWTGMELSPHNQRMLYIPKGFAHGFQTLEDDTELLYFISEPHAPDSAAGFRWNDARIGIEWPLAEPTMSNRDRDYADLDPNQLQAFRA
jgi:dTDP-4-dehydrorhamnose 3,5-epimerase